VLLLLVLCVVFAASPASVCGCRSSVLALVFFHTLEVLLKLLIFNPLLLNEKCVMHVF
jgi:hypothetical protein